MSNRTHPFVIPTHWTGQEALTIVHFLEALVLAIWDAHGTAMADCFERIGQLASIESARTPGINPRLDDKLPF